MSKTNHGPCLVCGRPILYLGASFCSPACNFDHIGGTVRTLAAKYVLKPAVAVVSTPTEPEPEPEPTPVVLTHDDGERTFSGFMFLEPAPDE